MIRFIASILGGYLVMAVLVVFGFSLAMVAPNFAFEQDSLDVTPGWILYSLVVSLIAAAAGGLVAAFIARLRSAAFVLAAFVFAIGLVSAASNLAKAKPSNEAVAGMSTLERAKNAKQPDWYAFLLPFVAAGGIALGGLCSRCAACSKGGDPPSTHPPEGTTEPVGG